MHFCCNKKSRGTHLICYKWSLHYPNLCLPIFPQKLLHNGLGVAEEQYLFFYWNVAIRKHRLFPSIIQRLLQKIQELTVQIYWSSPSLQHLLQCIIDTRQWRWRSSGSICFPLDGTAPKGNISWSLPFPHTSPRWIFMKSDLWIRS